MGKNHHFQNPNNPNANYHSKRGGNNNNNNNYQNHGQQNYNNTQNQNYNNTHNQHHMKNAQNYNNNGQQQAGFVRYSNNKEGGQHNFQEGSRQGYQNYNNNNTKIQDQGQNKIAGDRPDVTKTALCRWWMNKTCKFGNGCKFAHGQDDILKRGEFLQQNNKMNRQGGGDWSNIQVQGQKNQTHATKVKASGPPQDL